MVLSMLGQRVGSQSHTRWFYMWEALEIVEVAQARGFWQLLQD